MHNKIEIGGRCRPSILNFDLVGGLSFQVTQLGPFDQCGQGGCHDLQRDRLFRHSTILADGE